MHFVVTGSLMIPRKFHTDRSKTVAAAVSQLFSEVGLLDLTW